MLEQVFDHLGDNRLQNVLVDFEPWGAGGILQGGILRTPFIWLKIFYFFASKRLVKNDFNHLIFLFWEIT